MICWVPGCEADEYQSGCCTVHHHEGERMAALVLTEPYEERCAEWADLAMMRRAEREMAEKELQRRKAAMQQARWQLTGKVPRADDTLDAIRQDLTRDMSSGSRNAALNRAGYRFGRLVGGGVVTRPEAEAVLLSVATTFRLPQHEAKYVIARSLDDGSDNPYLTNDR